MFKRGDQVSTCLGTGVVKAVNRYPFTDATTYAVQFHSTVVEFTESELKLCTPKLPTLLYLDHDEVISKLESLALTYQRDYGSARNVFNEAICVIRELQDALGSYEEKQCLDFWR